jgi:hypothetical protein
LRLAVEAPFVYNVSCTGDALSFTTHDNLKRSSSAPGSYVVSAPSSGAADDDHVADRESLAVGRFDFAAHWRPTHIALELRSGWRRCASDADGCTIAVINHRLEKVNATFTCG